MLRINPVTRQKGECIAVGRGAVAIYLAFMGGDIPKGQVIVPANICYAAVFPIIYAGYTPTFCDVDPISGNVTLDTIKDAYKDSVVAGIIPHMYGNPVKDMLSIKQFFSNKNIVLIEDCASMMTNKGDDFISGTIGDYVIYSTGYSKTIDIGFGGLLFSATRSLANIEMMEAALPPYRDELEHEWDTFSKVYRVIRNMGQDSCIAKGIYKSLIESCRKSFIFSIEESKKQAIFSIILDLDKVIEQRKNKYRLYTNNLLNSAVDDKIFKYAEDAVPWRFNLLLEDNSRHFIDYCLQEKLPVSDWYPCVTPIFGVEKEYKGAAFHEKHIVNFPLMISDAEIDKICSRIKSYRGKK